ncbi:DUF4258 domain-containing protein [Sulfobacillus harzensis]|uniref:DUF4258 domain-containing protein n=1 Tax=Sulfobacillus harzensis TaxID=2729629 RepID=A0A7Y0Q326_9FIRM|nr:DUF4258 domain-containing protein [Sulfobacillus harzensis]NMP23147.1 DUF4258 domain-containing protein [Sulfobacillus harzensis]
MSRFVYRVHALQRMFERQIERSVVESVIQSGTTIESYPEDTPYPSRLVLGWDRDRPVHVVVADNPHDEETIVITVYQPDPMRWDASFSRRQP